MGNSFLKPDPVKHWADDPKSQWQYILFMQSPLDQMAKSHMEIDARTAYTYEAITVTEASTQNLVDAGIQYLASYKDGSVRLVFSSKKPAGVPDANWNQTNPEKGFFAYFRWYSPTKAFFDRSWKMGNITEVNN